MLRFISFVVLCTGCGGPFAKAKQQGTSSAYRSFANANPVHRRALMALERADQLDWDTAADLDSEDGYRAYLDESPKGIWREEAILRADAKGWFATDATDASAIRAHLADHSTCLHRSDAEALLERFAFAKADATGSLEELFVHFSAHPHGSTSSATAAQIIERSFARLEPLLRGDSHGGRLFGDVDVRLPGQDSGPEWVAYYAFLALILGDYPLADSLYAAQGAYAPDDFSSRNNLAVVLKRKGEFAVAREQFRVLTAERPDDLFAASNLSLELIREGEFSEAAEILEKVEAAGGPAIWMHVHRAASLCAQQETERAWVEIEQVATLLPSQDWFNQAEILEDLRLDPIYAPLREDPRFDELPTSVVHKL